MQYCLVGNDIALIMHYRALLKRSGGNKVSSIKWNKTEKKLYRMSYSEDRSDFLKAFHQVISSSKNHLFLKSDMLFSVFKNLGKSAI